MLIEQRRWADCDVTIHNRIAPLLACIYPDMKDNYYGPDAPSDLILATEDNDVIGHLALYMRSVLLDGVKTTIGLIGGVAVCEQHRRCGIASSLVAKGHQLLRDRNIGYCVLFAYDHKYYTSSGYRPMENETRFVEDGETRQFVYRGGMVAILGAGPWNVKLLDLQGETV